MVCCIAEIFYHGMNNLYHSNSIYHEIVIYFCWKFNPKILYCIITVFNNACIAQNILVFFFFMAGWGVSTIPLIIKLLLSDYLID